MKDVNHCISKAIVKFAVENNVSVIGFESMPIFFLSGTLFPLQNLHAPVYLISRINPLTYGVDGLRGAIIGMSSFGIYNDLAIIGTLSALVCAIGIMLFSKMEA